MKRSLLSVGLMVLSIASMEVMLASGVRAAEAKRPNIVFILADDLRYDGLGCTGSPQMRTPNIDRLAAEGLRFKNFFVATPLCSPSRASFLTGLYPHSHRVINNDKVGLDVVSHTLYTFPRMLREAGYETAFIGKWHMGLDDTRRPGFDLWISFKGQGLYLDPVVNIDGVPRQLDGYMTDHLNRWAVEFVERSHTKPFVLVLAHKGVHAPFIPAPRHEGLYGDVQPAVPPNARDDLGGKPVMRRKVERISSLELEGVAPEPAEPARGRRMDDPVEVVRNQMRCLASVDEGVGQILDALRRRGLLDETVVIFTSDNGYLHGEHGLYNTKYWPYEESIRVPFVMRYPPLIRPGTVRDELVLNVDLAPTLLDLAGVTPRTRFHGRSFVPLLRDPPGQWRPAILAEYFPEKVNPRVPAWQVVRTGRWKYIHYSRLVGMDELYDLASDPGELKNRIDDPDAAATLEQLKETLRSLLEASR